MGTKREAPIMAGFFKISKHGEGFAGRLISVNDIGTTKPNYIMLMSPCLIFRKGDDGKRVVEAWKAVTINQTGDLRRKIDPDQSGKDFGKIFTGVYRDDEAVPKQPSKMKIFAVEELSVAEFKELTTGADMTHAKESYPVLDDKKKRGFDDIGDEGTDDDVAGEADDELPF